VQSEADRYTVQTQVTTASADSLRATAVADVPAAILARYTQLPADFPARVGELAADVAGAEDNPYDQARALERFLRQYPYSLDVPLPPPDQDPVDYFLFDLQRGFCDYYASAMVVMARSLGLPARLATGYLPQPPDENGVQTIREINAHSWAEIYFAGYGWVEFEPTAAFASPHEGERPFTNTAPSTEPASDAPTTALPPRQPARPFWMVIGGRLALLAALALAGMYLWRRRQKPEAVGGVLWAYGRLQQQADKLDQPLADGQTPLEFEQALAMRLDGLGQRRRLVGAAARAKAGAARLTALFNARRYSRAKEDEATDETAVRTWRGVQRPFWLLRMGKKLMK
jgi:hypothetical protein